MRRREFIQGGVAAISVPGAVAAAEDCGDISFRGTFVLVHGANFGGWCWRDVRDQLRRAGYQVFAPTLTGLGNRSHLLSPELTLRDHIFDIANTILSEELVDVTLVGHSYGGTVITGVCDLLQDRISQAIFLDANTPADGEATIPGLTAEQAETALGAPLFEGYGVPPLPPARLGVPTTDETNTAWLERRMTPHPIATLNEPLKLRNGGCSDTRRTFILTTPSESLQPFAKKRLAEIRDDSAWQYRELLVGHAAMVTAPCEISELLIDIAATEL